MMSKKAIILKGNENSGKSTTIREVCKLLKPTEVKKLNLYLFQNWSENQFKKLCSKFPKDDLDKIFNIVEEKEKTIFEDVGLKLNDIFLIKVNGKWILVVGGSPSEIKIHIVIIILILIHIKIEISVVLTAVRAREGKKYDTDKELKDKGYKIVNNKPSKIERIDDSNFRETEEWKSRVDSIVELIKNNL